MSLNLITPVFYEKNFFDEKGSLHQEKQIIKGRFIYIINKFTKNKPDIVSEYYANSQGKLCRWDNSANGWKIIPIKQGKYYFYVTDNNIPLSENERKEIKQEWCSEKEVSSEFKQEICLDNKKILITLYEQNYFNKKLGQFKTEQLVKNKYAYVADNFDKGFEKNIKKYFINSDGYFCDEKKNVCLFFSKDFYIYVTFDEKEIKENNQFFFNKEVFQKIQLKNDKRQNKIITWQAEFIRQKILQSPLNILSRDKWKKQKINYKEMEYHFDYSIIAIHHSGDDVFNDWFGNIKTPLDIEEEHIKDNKWDDIGYHFLINPNGKIYEGRALYFKGSHIGNANSNKIGIVLIGDFEPSHSVFDKKTDTPTRLQINSLKSLILLLKNFSYIQILGGHRDWGNSLCPGENLYKMLPEIRKSVELKEPNEGQS